MDVSVFSTRPYDRRFLTAANASGAHRLNFLEPRLTVDTAKLAAGSQAVCVFVNDLLDAEILRMLADIGVRLVALRCAGFNRVDLREAGIRHCAAKWVVTLWQREGVKSPDSKDLTAQG